MSLINGAPLLTLLQGFRVAYIGGRLGAGKTLLAYRLAYELCEHHGYRYVISNCRDAWSDKVDDVVLRPNDEGVPTYIDAVIIIDEAGEFIEDARGAKQLVAYGRKMNVVFLMSSASRVPARVRALVIGRKFNLQVIGIPLIWFGVRVSGDFGTDEYAFGLWQPSEVYGVYDTGDFPVDDAGIGDFLWDYMVERSGGRGKYIRKRRNGGGTGAVSSQVGVRRRNSVGPVSSMAQGGGVAASAFESAAEEFAASISLLEKIQPKGRRRRR